MIVKYIKLKIKNWKRRLAYFFNFSAILTAKPQDPTVTRMGNTPLMSICGTCSKEIFSWCIIAATIGRANKPITPSFLLFLETFCCTLIVIVCQCLFVTDLFRMDLTFYHKFVQELNSSIYYLDSETEQWKSIHI